MRKTKKRGVGGMPRFGSCMILPLFLFHPSLKFSVGFVKSDFVEAVVGEDAEVGVEEGEKVVEGVVTIGGEPVYVGVVEKFALDLCFYVGEVVGIEHLKENIGLDVAFGKFGLEQFEGGEVAVLGTADLVEPLDAEDVVAVGGTHGVGVL